MLWKPSGILHESTVNEVVEFIEAVEKGNREPLNRFSDLSALYVKLHAMLTDYSPLHAALFTDRAAAANWLGVPLRALSE
jgi:hypothetical protein